MEKNHYWPWEASLKDPGRDDLTLFSPAVIIVNIAHKGSGSINGGQW